MLQGQQGSIQTKCSINRRRFHQHKRTVLLLLPAEEVPGNAVPGWSETVLGSPVSCGGSEEAEQALMGEVANLQVRSGDH